MKKALLTKLLVLTAACMWAQEIKWYAKVPKEVFADGIFEIHFILENAKGKNISFPSFDNLEIISGPSVSDQFYAVNGRATSNVTYSFEAIAKRPGTIRLGAATIFANGKKLATQPVQIIVQRSKKSNSQDPNEIAFVNLKLSKEKIYKGQQLVAEYQLYYNGNLGFEDAIQHPPMHDFYVTQLDLGNEALPGMASGNKNYRGVLADALALFPKKTGQLTIGKSYFPLKERLANEDPWSNPFGRYRSLTLTNAEKTVEVKDLPTPMPEHFNGVVGHYEGSAVLAEEKVAANQTIVVRIELNGNGDPSTLSPPTLRLPSQLEAYPAKVLKEEQYSQGHELKHSHVWEIPVTAKEAGNYEIKVDFQYFDPESSTYKLLDFPSLDVAVTGSHQSISKHFEQKKKKSKWPYYFIGLTSICLGIGGWLYLRKKESQTLIEDPTLDSPESSTVQPAKPQPVSNRLSQLHDLWEEGRPNEFYIGLSQLLQEQISEELGLTMEEQDKSTVVQQLQNISASADLKGLYLSVRSGIELALYGGGLQQDGLALLSKTQQFIENLSSSLKNTQSK